MTILRVTILGVTAFTFIRANAFLTNDPYIPVRTVGHEEITGQALNRLDTILNAEGKNLFNIAPGALSDATFKSSGGAGLGGREMIIQGNAATDFPYQPNAYLSIPAFHAQSFDNWTYNPNIQILHFLKNRFANNALVNQYETCVTARSEILRTTIYALQAWAQGNRKTALFMLGHATHAIQDSFSPAHTQRDTHDRNNDILKICYYGTPVPFDSANCYHENLDVRDVIWIRNEAELSETQAEFPGQVATVGDSGFMQNDVRGKELETTMKAEARLARAATLRYLYVVSEYISAQGIHGLNSANLRNEVAQLLTYRVFEGSTGIQRVDNGGEPSAYFTLMPDGIIRCDQLQSGANPSSVATEELALYADMLAGTGAPSNTVIPECSPTNRQ